MADFNTFSLADAYSKAQAVRSAQQAEQMQGIQMQQLQQQQAIRSRLSEFVGQDGSIDMQRAIPPLLQAGDYHSIAALAALQKANKPAAGNSIDERLMGVVQTYKQKKDNGIPTTKMEDDQARMAYEHLTQPKVTPEGPMFPRYSAGNVFETDKQPAPTSGAPSPYSQTPYSPNPRATIYPTVKPAERLNDDTKKFADDLEKNKVPQLLASTRRLNNVLNQYTPQNIPGVGYLKNTAIANVPVVGLSEAGKDVKSTIQAAANDMYNALAGLNVTGIEETRRQLESMVKGEFSAQDMYNAWPNIVNRVNALTGNLVAGAPNEVLKNYKGKEAAIDLSPIEPPAHARRDLSGNLNKKPTGDPLVVDGYRFPNAAAAQAYRKATGK